MTTLLRTGCRYTGRVVSKRLAARPLAAAAASSNGLLGFFVAETAPISSITSPARRPLSTICPSRPHSTAAAAAEEVDSTNDDDDAIRMADYTYHLDQSSIALYPASPRGSSKLLQVDEDGNVTHHPNFAAAFPKLLAAGVEGGRRSSHVVFNESRVLNARLSVRRSTSSGVDGESLEMMILDAGEIEQGRACLGSEFTVMLRREGVRVGDRFAEATTAGAATFEVVRSNGQWVEDEKSQGNGTECVVRVVQHDGAGIVTLGDLLDVCGTVPIPPYLNRDAEESDATCYNNVYAAAAEAGGEEGGEVGEGTGGGGGGSVAAPTAGLHFTDAVLRQLESSPDDDGEVNDANSNAVKMSYLSLHVGAGTFKPVTVDDAREHVMHAERFRLNVGEVRRIAASLEEGRIVTAVGTTSSRTLESLYWCGVRRLRGMEEKEEEENDDEVLRFGQEEWIPLSEDMDDEGDIISAPDALRALLEGKSDDDHLEGSTALMIVPGGRYRFRIVDRLVTNFHAPDSTLMLLVSAFLGSGRKVRNVYEEAATRGYKFLSYGDACIFSRPR